MAGHQDPPRAALDRRGAGPGPPGERAGAGDLSCGGGAVMEDLTGRVFGRWTAVASAGKVKNGRAAYECRCECGTVRVVAASRLKDGSSASCGCLRSEVTARRNTKHGMADTAEHNIWRLMKA